MGQNRDKISTNEFSQEKQGNEQEKSLVMREKTLQPKYLYSSCCPTNWFCYLWGLIPRLRRYHFGSVPAALELLKLWYIVKLNVDSSNLYPCSLYLKHYVFFLFLGVCFTSVSVNQACQFQGDRMDVYLGGVRKENIKQTFATPWHLPNCTETFTTEKGSKAGWKLYVIKFSFFVYETNSKSLPFSTSNSLKLQ